MGILAIHRHVRCTRVWPRRTESVLVPDLDFQHSHCCHPVPARSTPHRPLAILLFLPRTHKPPAASGPLSRIFQLQCSPLGCACGSFSPITQATATSHQLEVAIHLRTPSFLGFMRHIICIFFLVFINIYSYCLICLLPTMNKRTNEEFISDWMPQSHSEPDKAC